LIGSLFPLIRGLLQAIIATAAATTAAAAAAAAATAAARPLERKASCHSRLNPADHPWYQPCTTHLSPIHSPTYPLLTHPPASPITHRLITHPPTHYSSIQALSIRPDLLSPAAMGELQKLCDKVPSFDSAIAMQVRGGVGGWGGGWPPLIRSGPVGCEAGCGGTIVGTGWVSRLCGCCARTCGFWLGQQQTPATSSPLTHPTHQN